MEPADRAQHGGLGRLTVRRLAVVALAAQVLYTLTWVTAGLFEPRFSFWNNYTSDLGALTARHALAYNVGLCASAVLTMPLAVALWRTRPDRNRPWATAAVIVGVFSVGQLIDGLAREDCPAGVDAACRAAVRAGHVSWHHRVHDTETVVTFLALLLAPLVFAVAARRVERWRSAVPPSAVAFAVEFIALGAFVVLFGRESTTGQGVFEIIFVTAGVAWLAWLAYRLAGVVEVGPA